MKHMKKNQLLLHGIKVFKLKIYKFGANSLLSNLFR